MPGQCDGTYNLGFGGSHLDTKLCFHDESVVEEPVEHLSYTLTSFPEDFRVHDFAQQLQMILQHLNRLLQKCRRVLWPATTIPVARYERRSTMMLAFRKEVSIHAWKVTRVRKTCDQRVIYE